MIKWFILPGGLLFLSIILSVSIGPLREPEKQSALQVQEVDQGTQEPIMKLGEFRIPDILNREEEPQKKNVLAWIPYWDQERALASFEKHIELIDYMSLFWYYLDSDGNVRPYQVVNEDANIIKKAQEQGVQVFAVVANLPDYPEGGSWDADRVNKVIGTAEARTRHIEDLLHLVDDHGFDGINIDYEALQKSQRDDFSAFIKELGEELHDREKLLAIALHPKTSEGNPAEDNGSAAQDWQKLALFADQLHFMTYEEHYSKSDPGPVASIDWVKNIIGYARSMLGIPAEKMFIGIPLYGYDWQERRKGGYAQGKGLEYEDIMQIVKELGVSINFDQTTQVPFLKYEKNGRNHVIWFENAQSAEKKIDLTKQYNIPNIALWRIGQEDPAVWDVIDLFRD